MFSGIECLKISRFNLLPETVNFRPSECQNFDLSHPSVSGCLIASMDSDDSSDDDYQIVMSMVAATTSAIRNSDAALEDLIDSSDDDEAQPPLQWGGSRLGRSPNKKRDFDLAFNNI